MVKTTAGFVRLKHWISQKLRQIQCRTLTRRRTSRIYSLKHPTHSIGALLKLSYLNFQNALNLAFCNHKPRSNQNRRICEGCECGGIHFDNRCLPAYSDEILSKLFLWRTKKFNTTLRIFRPSCLNFGSVFEIVLIPLRTGRP